MSRDIDLRDIKTVEDSMKVFAEETRKEYESANQIEKFSIPIKDKQIDDDFKKIGSRPQMELDFFDPNSNVIPIIVGLGESIANGEKKYFVENILDKYNEEDIRKINSQNINENTIPDIVHDINRDEIVILSSVEFVYKILLKRDIISAKDWDADKNCFTINGIPLYTLPKKYINIDDNVIILDRQSAIWRYVTDKENNKLHIKIDPKKTYYDIHVFVLVKPEVNIKNVRVISIID